MVPHTRRHPYVDPGKGKRLFGEVHLVAYLMRCSTRVNDQSEIGRGQIRVITQIRSAETFALV